MNRFLLAALAALMLCSADTRAGTLEDGVAAHQRGEYATALGAFRVLAEEGNAAAQFNLGQMYRLGQGVSMDPVEAARRYRQAAAQGDAQSQYNMGVMYFNAEGAPRNLVFSHMWLTLSAMSGVENAARNRTIVTREMTPEQITEALQLARICRQRNFKNCD